MSNVSESRRSYIIDGIIIASKFAVACSVAVALVVELSLEPLPAVLFALIGCFAFITSHIALRKMQSASRVANELSDIRGADKAIPQQRLNAMIKPVHNVQVKSAEQKTKQQPRSPHHADSLKHQKKHTYATGVKILHSEESGPVEASKVAAAKTPARDIDKIIHRLASDISNGRKASDGVSAVRVAQALNKAETEVSGSRRHNVLQYRDGQISPSLASPAAETARAKRANPDATDKLAAIADALARERLDIFLEPIQGLDNSQTRHFEVSIRLKLSDGNIMDVAEYSEAARGSAWLPLIDVVKVSQAKKVALYLLRRGQSGAFISQINGESVSSSSSFSDDLASIMGEDQLMAGRLVLSLAQDDVRGFSPAQWSTIERLRHFGFRFAISDVNSLDMDFEMLARRGFAFVKLDASIFLEGLPAAQTLIPPTDVCRYLAGAGLTLVVNGLKDEAQKAKVLGFGALYGQGLLFGAPRPVKIEALQASQKTKNITHQPELS